MAAVTICSDFGAQKNKVSQPLFPHLLAMKCWTPWTTCSCQQFISRIPVRFYPREIGIGIETDVGHQLRPSNVFFSWPVFSWAPALNWLSMNIYLFHYRDRKRCLTVLWDRQGCCERWYMQKVWSQVCSKDKYVQTKGQMCCTNKEQKRKKKIETTKTISVLPVILDKNI